MITEKKEVRGGTPVTDCFSAGRLALRLNSKSPKALERARFANEVKEE